MIVSFLDRLKLRPRSGAAARPDRRARPDREPARERPGNWVADNELADTLARQGNVDDAVSQLCALGDRLAADGFLARAHAIYKKALRLQPANAHAVQRAAELGVERINQSTTRLTGRQDDTGPLDGESAAPLAAAADAPDPAGEEPDATSEALVALPIDLVADETPVASEPDAAPKTVAEIIQDATVMAAYGDVSTAVRALTDCARANPDLVEPVTALIEIAGRNGLDDVHANAAARLCELYCRRDDYEAARAIAEALVLRYPDDPRHRARLGFVEAAVEELQEVVVVPLDAVAEAPAMADRADALDPLADTGAHPFDRCRERARIDVAAGDWVSALQWLEQAAAAIPDSAAETALAYDIALVLEGAGDHHRAVGVLSEIAAKAGADYRDVGDRIRRLSERGH